MAYKFQLGDARLSGALRQEGTIVADDKLTVGSGGAEITGAVALSSTIDVAGAATLASTLDAAGAVSLAASGLATDIRGTLSVDEAAVFDNTLQAVGVATFDAGLTASAASDMFDIMPNSPSAHDLGAVGAEWRQLYVDVIEASALSGTLEHPLSAAAGAGITAFTYDNSTAGVTVAVSGAAQLSNDHIVMWNNTDGKFVDSKITEGLGNIQIDAGADLITINGDIKSLNANVSASADILAGGNADIAGTLAADGAATLGSTLAVTGIATFSAVVSASSGAEMGSIMPAAATDDLGASTDQWQAVYAQNFYASTAISASAISGALEFPLTQGVGIEAFSYDNSQAGVSVAVSGAASLANEIITKWDGNAFVDSLLQENASNVEQTSGHFKVLSGDLSASANLDVGSAADIGGTLTVDGNSTLAGELDVNDFARFNSQVTLGTVAADFVDFVGEVSSSIIPSGSGQFDLGSSSNAWENIYVNNIIGADLALDIDQGTSFAAGVDVLFATGNSSLPACSDGKLIRIKNVAQPAASITLTASGSDTIEDGSSTTIELETQGAAVSLIGSGSNWMIF